MLTTTWAAGGRLGQTHAGGVGGLSKVLTRVLGSAAAISNTALMLGLKERSAAGSVAPVGTNSSHRRL